VGISVFLIAPENYLLIYPEQDSSSYCHQKDVIYTGHFERDSAFVDWYLLRNEALTFL